MAVERAVLWVAEAVMLAAFACFIRGFQLRKTNRAAHMRLGKLGALLVVAGLLVVEVLLRGLHWNFPIRSRTVLHVHITVASVALALLLLLVWTGMKGPRALHVRLYLFFFPLYAATIALSFGAFALW